METVRTASEGRDVGMRWPHVSIVVVTYNSKSHIPTCVRGLLSQTYPAFDLSIVDNASDDGTLENIPGPPELVRIRRLPRNLGFAAACNVGLRAAGSDYVALVNPDVEVSPDWLFPIVEQMETDQTIAAAQPKIFISNSDNTVNSDGGHLSFLGFAWSGGNGRPDNGSVETKDVAFPSGAAVVLRKSAVDQVGAFDPAYFLYHEDVDLGLRLWRAGHRCVSVQSASVSHDYAAWRHPRKIAYLEENRWATIAKNFSRRSLVKALPFLLLAEALVLAYCFRRGWGRLKLGAMAGFLRRFREVLHERRDLSSQLGTDDRAFLRLLEGSWQDALDEPLRFSFLHALFDRVHVAFFAGGQRTTPTSPPPRSWSRAPPRKIWLVASHGGHLSELLDMLAYDPENMLLVTYDSARTRAIKGSLRLRNIGRNPLRLVVTFLLGLTALLRSRPQLVVSTGAEIAIPVLLGAWLLGTSTIYIESCTRVSRPTLTGKLVYPFSTLFLVQSQKLLRHYGPRALYRGGLV